MERLNISVLIINMLVLKNDKNIAFSFIKQFLLFFITKKCYNGIKIAINKPLTFLDMGLMLWGKSYGSIL